MILKRNLLFGEGLLETVATIVCVLAELQRLLFLHVSHHFLKSFFVGLLIECLGTTLSGDIHAPSKGQRRRCSFVGISIQSRDRAVAHSVKVWHVRARLDIHNLVQVWPLGVVHHGASSR